MSIACDWVYSSPGASGVSLVTGSMKRFLPMAVIDLVAAYLMVFIATVLRYDFAWRDIPLGTFLVPLIWLPPLFVGGVALVGFYRTHWRYLGSRDMLPLGYGVALATGAALILRYLLKVPIPVSILLMSAVFVVVGLLFIRFVLRTSLGFNIGNGHGSNGLGTKGMDARGRRRVLIAGAGDAGDMVARDVHRHQSFDLVGLVDDQPDKQGMTLRGYPVLGTCDDIPDLVNRLNVHDVFIAMPSATGHEIRRVMNLVQQSRAVARIVPGLPQMLGAAGVLPMLRPVQLEDLLRREPVQTDLEQVRSYIANRRVLVTGGGGSIGSELCRQIAQLGPDCIIILGHGENSVFEIQQELRQDYPSVKVECWIGTVKNYRRMEYLFESCKPQVVFHAAAHKHVPLMESNAMEAVLNNVLGTRNVVQLCVKYEVKRCVFISTDKAVNPSSVMGATKRLGEIIVQAVAANQEVTEFSIVRFGNVLGSRGSVIPIMRAQIAKGGPVTVTDPAMTRYFMTIPEAVKLVLQAAVYGGNAEVFVLDMGEPVKIVDMARDLITLSGFIPEQDIAIQYTGIRPGEKLHEELVYEHETVFETPHKRIKRMQGDDGHLSEMMMMIDRLIDLAEEHKVHEAKELLRDLVSNDRLGISSTRPDLSIR